MNPPAALARTHEPPYYVVIFTSLRTEGDRGYGDMAQRMAELAAKQPGFLGVESARGAEGLGLTISYWRDEASIMAWKSDTTHQQAQRRWPADVVCRLPGARGQGGTRLREGVGGTARYP